MKDDTQRFLARSATVGLVPMGRRLSRINGGARLTDNVTVIEVLIDLEIDPLFSSVKIGEHLLVNNPGISTGARFLLPSKPPLCLTCLDIGVDIDDAACFCPSCFRAPADEEPVLVDGIAFDANRIAVLLQIAGDAARYEVQELSGKLVLVLNGDDANTFTMHMREDLQGPKIEDHPRFNVVEHGDYDFSEVAS